MNTKELLSRCADLNIQAYVYDGSTPPSGCDVIIVEKNTRESNAKFMPLKQQGWKIIKGSGYTFVKNDEILNDIIGFSINPIISSISSSPLILSTKNPQSGQIALEKPVENAIIEEPVEEPVEESVEPEIETPVGTTPDPAVLFPEEKPKFKPYKKQW